MLNLLYLVHDVTDPAIRRRILMLEAGGAQVTVAGFRRGSDVPTDNNDFIDLGVTLDGKFGQRIAAVGRAAFSIGSKLSRRAKPDVIIARNLEMLALANRANAVFGGAVPIVYECLDIHRLLLRKDAAGRALRMAEGYLGRNVSLLITSSPAFVEHYFGPVSRLKAPVLLLENQVIEFDTDAMAHPQPRPPAAGTPWKIGWFGALRCRKSLQLLAAFSRAMDGRFEIVLRGRPAYSEFEDFNDFVESEPYLSFQGAYRNPEDLGRIYDEVQFSWAIDFFEEGLNSSWLLPNRLYEGCRHGAVPVAMRGTETARFLESRSIGLVLDRADSGALVGLLGAMTPERYEAEFRKVADVGARSWVFDKADCRRLVSRLASLRAGGDRSAAFSDIHETQSNEGGLL
ncbi:glycosyl transferase family 1 [Pararhizobium gei]|uniref:glycosyl transferase family 1 n=1 Tax=Pararhizobium gei TaxID=1395951 RepID=UPI0023DBBE57|nr:glycosyl transferase family 1 [Rhizobium gei]